MDLAFTLDIGIYNIALDWEDKIEPVLPVIDPSPPSLNNDPCSTSQERERMMKQIEPFIEANRKIPAVNYCLSFKCQWIQIRS